MYILKWVQRCWRIGVFLRETTTSWDGKWKWGNERKMCLMWQDWHPGHMVGSRLLPQEWGNCPSPSSLPFLREETWGFFFYKAHYLFLRFLDVSNSHDCFGEPLISSALFEAVHSCIYSEVHSVGSWVMVLMLDNVWSKCPGIEDVVSLAEIAEMWVQCDSVWSNISTKNAARMWQSWIFVSSTNPLL